MAEATPPTVDTGARPADQQGGNTSPVNPKELLSQLEPDVRTIAQAAINSVAKKLGDEFSQKLGKQAEELTAANERLAALDEFRQGMEQSLAGDEETPPDVLTEIEQKLTPPAWVKGAEQRRLWQYWARNDYIQQQRFNALIESDEGNRKTITALQQQITNDAESRKTLEESRSAALRKADLAGMGKDAADLTAFIRYHKDNVVTDPKTGETRYLDEEGQMIPLQEGIARFTPDVLRKPAIESGGSGARGGRAGDPEAELKAAEAEVAATQRRAQESNGNMRAVADFQAAQRKLKALKSAQAA